MKYDKHGFNNVIRLGLERIEAMLEHLGRPDRELKFVHVAGTNGKGSTCAMIEAALISDGKRVGKYTSPNLVRVNERICVNGEMINDNDLDEVLTRAGEAADSVREKLGEEPTQFEIWTAAAMLHFANCKCDIVVLEVGLGGEFDATNIIEKCELAVICKIELDHTAYLGDTIAKIASAKCGIIKDNITTGKVVTTAQLPEALEVVRKYTEYHGHELIQAKIPSADAFDGIHEYFIYKGKKVRLSLGGVYQLENAAVAVSALEALGVSEKSICHGLENAVHHARFEEITDGVIFDGGHNPDGVRALNSALDRYFTDCEMNIIYACMADKDVKSVLDILKNEKRSFIFTTVSDNPRAMGAEALCELAKAECGISGKYSPTLSGALELAKGLTIICGSLYLYSDLPKDKINII
ncbi:MAG: bifunctional folylpolyglutamate synthase/dihydrofolate synthase [Ruminococcaceae bacterium]|nr:bifunctional folylpolyglutamate synthase/dihydrofolate synthase [Oscillospiraceae bacterium]